MRNQATRDNLESKKLGEIINQYLAWQARLIRPRKREVVIWPEVAASPYYPSYANEIADLEARFKSGDDLNPYLSNQVRTHAYAASLPPPTTTLTTEEWVKRHWRGKDRMRVTVDAHHLHLGGMQADGKVARSDPLLFVAVTRERAFFLTIGDHNSFDDGTVSSIMYDKLEAQLASAGGGVAMGGPMVTLGGTQVKDTMRSIQIVKALRAVDSELAEQGHNGLADRILRLEYDDILIVDPSGDLEIRRLPGLL